MGDKINLRKIKDAIPESASFVQHQGDAQKPSAKNEASDKNEGRRLSFSSMKPVPRKNLPDDLAVESPAPQPVDHEKQRQSFVLKDSIHFKTNMEYLHYLHECLSRVGLTPELYQQFKVLHMSNKDIEALEGIWRHLADLGLGECERWLECAEVLRQLEAMDAAFEYLNKAVVRYPSDVQAVYAMAMFYKLKKDYESSEHWLKKWKLLDGLNPEVYYHLSTVYKRTGALELARKHLLECLSYDPQHLRAKALLDKLV